MAKRPPSDLSLFDLPEQPDPPSSGTDRGGRGPSDGTEAVALHEAAQARYLNYALSVITARALPDVRDGMPWVGAPSPSMAFANSGLRREYSCAPPLNARMS